MFAVGGSIVAASYRIERMSGLALGALALIVSVEDERRCSDDAEEVLMGRVTMASIDWK